MKVQLIDRPKNKQVEQAVKESGFSPLVAHLIAGRTNVANADYRNILHPSLKDIPHPALLLNCEKGAKRIADAIVNQEAIMSIGDFDADGQTGNSVISVALMKYFNVPMNSFKAVVGHRFEQGYGISQGLCDDILAMNPLPDLIISTDCGSSDQERIKQLKDKGVDVVVTDHHEVPKDGVPMSAYCTINPVQPGCNYPDKAVAGCMVAFLVMCQVRIELINRGYLSTDAPNLFGLLDYVALGTIADAVSLLSATNRMVIKYGLEIINQRKRPCWSTLAGLLDLKLDQPFTSQDLGYQVAPRINARSRMDDPYLALFFLLSESETTASEYLLVLDMDNAERKDVEKKMKDIAFQEAEKSLMKYQHSIVVAHESFHAGVQGIVASRITESYGVPSVVLSPSNEEGVYTGSCRTVDKVHIRQVLQDIEDRNPGILIQFGGHKGAAGLKIPLVRIPDFHKLFEEAVIRHLGSTDPLLPAIRVDGSLETKGLLSLQSCDELELLQPFGNGFEEPVFNDSFYVNDARFVGSDNPVHLSLDLKTKGGRAIKGIWFFAVNKEGDPMPVRKNSQIHCAYKLSKNFYRGNTSLQLMIQYAS